jgi:hypothetical protein
MSNFEVFFSVFHFSFPFSGSCRLASTPNRLRSLDYHCRTPVNRYLPFQPLHLLLSSPPLLSPLSTFAHQRSILAATRQLWPFIDHIQRVNVQVEMSRTGGCKEWQAWMRSLVSPALDAQVVYICRTNALLVSNQIRARVPLGWHCGAWSTFWRHGKR